MEPATTARRVTAGTGAVETMVVANKNHPGSRRMPTLLDRNLSSSLPAVELHREPREDDPATTTVVIPVLVVTTFSTIMMLVTISARPSVTTVREELGEAQDTRLRHP